MAEVKKSLKNDFRASVFVEISTISEKR